MRLLEVKRSPKPTKKLVATFDDDGKRRTVHFGAKSYGDFTLYWKQSPKLAREKRLQYIARHRVNEDWTDPCAPGTLSRFILWEKPTIEQAVRAYKKRYAL